ncbi:MAG: hypothetical protein ACLR8P_19135 [Clostridium fessum]
MVDIIWSADAAFQMHVVVDGSDDIFLGNVLRNQVGGYSLRISFFNSSISQRRHFFQNTLEIPDRYTNSVTPASSGSKST